jgi:phospholipase/carboxylesterase
LSEIKNYKGKVDYIHIDNKSQKTIFMLHGYGANMRDLAPLAGLNPDLRKYNWIFPDGLIKVPLGPYMSGRAWFPINMEELNRAMMAGDFESLFADHIPEGLEEAAKTLKEMILDLGGEDYLIGGFSQGSMMANALTFFENLNPKALILLSSTLVAKKRMTERLEKSAWRGPIFQSHGTGDPVLPVSMARALTALIRESERQVTSIEFNGGHETPPVVMQQLNEFLKKNNQSER